VPGVCRRKRIALLSRSALSPQRGARSCGLCSTSVARRQNGVWPFCIKYLCKKAIFRAFPRRPSLTSWNKALESQSGGNHPQDKSALSKLESARLIPARWRARSKSARQSGKASASGLGGVENHRNHLRCAVVVAGRLVLFLTGLFESYSTGIQSYESTNRSTKAWLS
jgi:hypothetical protein